MAALSAAPHHSPNLHKYASPNRLYQWHLRQVKQTLLELVDRAEAQTVLDAGCGEGFVAGYLAEQRPSLSITGVDFSPDAIRYAQERWSSVRFRTGNVYKLPFSDRSFDLALCCEVLEHLEAPERAIAELKRVARRFVLISVPLEPYFQWLNTAGQKLGLSMDPGHVNFWGRDDFRRCIGKHFEQPQFAAKHYYQYALAPVGAAK